MKHCNSSSRKSKGTPSQSLETLSVCTAKTVSSAWTYCCVYRQRNFRHFKAYGDSGPSQSGE